MRKLPEGEHRHTQAPLHCRIENRSREKKSCYFNNEILRDSEGKWVDVLLGKYDKQRGKMRDGREVDVQMCPRSKFSEMHMSLQTPAQNIERSGPQTEEAVDKEI